MKVYIVTDGEYSDYHIEAVFTDEKKAKQYAAIHRCDTIEEYEADTPQIEGETDVFVVHKIGINSRLGFYVYDHYYTTEKISSVKTHCGTPAILVSLTEQDDSKAKKIAQDMWAEYKANKNIK